MIRSKRYFFLAILIGAALVSSRPMSAADPVVQSLENQIQAVRGDVMERRESAIKVLVTLDDAQAKAFRPLVSQYDAELKKLGEAREALLREFLKVHKAMTPEQAKDIGRRSLKLDEDRNALRRKYFELLSDQVSPVAAAQFLQLERQFETMLDFQVQAIVPLAGP